MTGTIVMVVAVVWTVLSVIAVGISLWGYRMSRSEERECAEDLQRIVELGIGNGRLALATEEHDQAKRKRTVMITFMTHQLLFLGVGIISIVIPSNPVTATVGAIYLIKHIGSTFALLAGQGLIVWGQILLSINVQRRQFLHSTWGRRERNIQETEDHP